MAQIGLDTRLRMVRSSLPALVHFDFKPLRVPIGRPIRALRVYLPQHGSLNIRGLEIQLPTSEKSKDGPAPVFDTSRAAFSMSSRAKASGAPELAFNARGLITESEGMPYWEMRIRRPVDIRALLITNRRGSTSSRNSAICIDYEDADGNSWTFDNAGVDTLLTRLRIFDTELNKLCTEDWHGSDPSTGEKLAKIHEVGVRLSGALKTALQGKEWSATEMDADRIELLELITAFVDKAPKDIKVNALPRGATVLEYLLYRGADRSAPEGTETEVLAVGIIFGALFVRDQRVANRKLRENQRFVQSPARAKFMDNYVSDTYFEMTGDDSLFPIMIRSHGLTGSHLLKHPHEYVNSLKEVETLFGTLGYQVAICYGTFLGAYREKAFIPHDDDLDTALLLKSTTLEEAKMEIKQVVETLQAQGVTINATAAGFMKIKAPVAGRRMDVFPVIPSDDKNVHMIMEKLRFRDVPREVVLPFDKIMFYDTEFMCPANAEQFLEQRYGPTWNIPLRQVGGKTIAAEIGVEGDFADFT